MTHGRYLWHEYEDKLDRMRLLAGNVRTEHHRSIICHSLRNNAISNHTGTPLVGARTSSLCRFNSK